MARKRKRKTTKSKIPFGTIQAKGGYKLVFGSRSKYRTGSKTFRTRTAAVNYVKKKYAK